LLCACSLDLLYDLTPQCGCLCVCCILLQAVSWHSWCNVISIAEHIHAQDDAQDRRVAIVRPALSVCISCNTQRNMNLHLCMLQYVTRTKCLTHVGDSLALLHLDGCLYLLRHDACCSQAAKLSSVEAKTVFVTVQTDPCGQPYLGVASDEALKVWSWCCHHSIIFSCSMLAVASCVLAVAHHD
jgi:hypothetical protein